MKNHNLILKKLDKPTTLFTDIRAIIEASRQRVATSVNAELSTLYWLVGKRINDEVLGNERAEYGKQIVATINGRVWQRLERTATQAMSLVCPCLRQPTQLVTQRVTN
jgi:hypothetical protein